MKGRIANSIKQRAQQDFNKYGVMAWRYACYDIDWSKPLSDYDSRYLRALSKIIDRKGKQ